MYLSFSATSSNARLTTDCALQLKSARSMERQAALQAQQSANSLKHTSSILRSPSLTGALKGLSMRAGRGGAEGGPSAATPMPDKATKSVPAHDGGCFTCAFDRSAIVATIWSETVKYVVTVYDTFLHDDSGNTYESHTPHPDLPRGSLYLCCA